MRYEEIKVGDVYSFKKAILKKDVLCFAKLSGDHNKLHTDEKFSRKTKFKKNIAHGMLAASFFSKIIGMHWPGQNGIYLSQSIFFKAPLFVGDTVEVKGTVLDKNDSVNIITIQTEIFVGKTVAVFGKAKILVFKNE